MGCIAAVPREHHVCSVREMVILGPDIYTRVYRPILPSLSLNIFRRRGDETSTGIPQCHERLNGFTFGFGLFLFQDF